MSLSVFLYECTYSLFPAINSRTAVPFHLWADLSSSSVLPTNYTQGINIYWQIIEEKLVVGHVYSK